MGFINSFEDALYFGFFAESIQTWVIMFGFLASCGILALSEYRLWVSRQVDRDKRFIKLIINEMIDNGFPNVSNDEVYSMYHRCYLMCYWDGFSAK